eukprot:GHVR01051390.1.p1 GENE.GHVR01051390.1~~GHVR01051390.1.p1  ORF type:complete len:140 (-),score=27.95 GHVR01051390.1:2254-2673(-)
MLAFSQDAEIPEEKDEQGATGKEAKEKETELDIPSLLFLPRKQPTEEDINRLFLTKNTKIPKEENSEETHLEQPAEDDTSPKTETEENGKHEVKQSNVRLIDNLGIWLKKKKLQPVAGQYIEAEVSILMQEPLIFYIPS